MSGDGQQPPGAESSCTAVTEHSSGVLSLAVTQQVPIIEVAFTQGKWWSMPQELSAQLYAKHAQGENAGYTWNWGEGGQAGTWRPQGEDTHINRYAIDFGSGIQTNIDTGYRRSIRIVWVRPQDVEPRFTGWVTGRVAETSEAPR